ncbi:MAG: hypothetical protein J0H74_19670 [Chitinophagaceae bacterium]|nr:hypothetical protein [Chitinophagaceae bacterium]
MDDLELGELWKQYNQKIERANILNLQSWVLQLQTFEYLQTEKARSRLNALSRWKKWMIALGLLWVLFLVFLVAGSLAWSKIFFVVSVAAILGFNIYAVLVYIYHTVLIAAIDNSESLMEVQEKTARLKTSTLQATRILFLQTPFYATFFWSFQWIRESPVSFWLITFPIALLLTVGAVWLYRNIHPGNSDKKWFKLLFSGKEWTSVIRAMDYLKEIEEYKKNNI